MSEVRAVPLSREQMQMLEQVGLHLMRAGDQHASGLLTIALAWKIAPTVRYECDIDESAGLAEVIELDGRRS